MSELMNTRNSNRAFHRQLLTTVSALALLAAVYGSSEAKAADQDTDRPTVWIELGGDLEHMSGQGENFPIGFLATYPKSPVLQGTTPLQAQNPPPFDFAEEGRISFQPEGSDWIFSAAVNYGRSSNFKHVDHQTKGAFHEGYISGVPSQATSINGTDDFADTQVHRHESHAILDFSAGKDVGLGMFGRNGSSTLSLGVRFAQFASRETLNLRARPDLQFKYAHFTFSSHRHTAKLPYFHTYYATGQASRSFHGIGPSLSWNGSAPFVGNPQNGEVTFDWGVNAAILFGRQKAHVRHLESAHYQNPQKYNSLAYYHTPHSRDTDRSVIVPNVGGFAGATWRIENFKASLGYRADFFFGAIDGGIDARKSETTGFYGPFATISVGIP